MYLDGSPAPGDPKPEAPVEYRECVRVPVDTPERMIASLLGMIANTEGRQITRLVASWRTDVSIQGVKHRVTGISADSEQEFDYPPVARDEHKPSRDSLARETDDLRNMLKERMARTRENATGPTETKYDDHVFPHQGHGPVQAG